MQNYGILTKRAESSSSSSENSDSELNNGLKCKNFKTCKGKGNTTDIKICQAIEKKHFARLKKIK